MATKEYMRKWRLENREHLLKYGKEYREANRQKRLEYSKKWHEENQAREFEYRQQYNLANRERRNEYARNYYQAHREERIAYSLRYVREHPEWREARREKDQESKRRWDKANPVRRRVNTRNRRARLNGNGGKLPLDVESILFEQQSGACYLCAKPLFGRFDDPPSVEHKIPVSRGGRNDLENVGLAHFSCNSKKGTKTAEEFEWDMEQEKAKGGENDKV